MCVEKRAITSAEASQFVRSGLTSARYTECPGFLALSIVHTSETWPFFSTNISLSPNLFLDYFLFLLDLSVTDIDAPMIRVKAPDFRNSLSFSRHRSLAYDMKE